MKEKDVIYVKISEYLNLEDKEFLFQKSIDFVDGPNYYNRQGGTRKEKLEKAYRGFVSEFILKKIIDNFNYNSNLNIKFEGLLDLDLTKKADVCDIFINGVLIDIKSSGEKKSDLTAEKYINYGFYNRNFILPVDQKPKEYNIQILYDKSDTYLYVFGVIDTQTLINKGVIRNLSVSSDGTKQESYLYSLQNGYSLVDFLESFI